MKNKGYYGWIHSLNEAAMQSRQNGIEMLAEQASRKEQMLNEANDRETPSINTRIKGNPRAGNITDVGEDDPSPTTDISKGFLNLLANINYGKDSGDPTTHGVAPLPAKDQITLGARGRVPEFEGKNKRIVPLTGSQGPGFERAIRNITSMSQGVQNAGASPFDDTDSVEIPDVEGFEPNDRTPSKMVPDVDVYREIRATKDAELASSRGLVGSRAGEKARLAAAKLAKQRNSAPNLKVVNRDGDYDADAGDALLQGRLAQANATNFSDPTGAQARIETGNPVMGDDEIVARAGQISRSVSGPQRTRLRGKWPQTAENLAASAGVESVKSKEDINALTRAALSNLPSRMQDARAQDNVRRDDRSRLEALAAAKAATHLAAQEGRAKGMGPKGLEDYSRSAAREAVRATMSRDRPQTSGNPMRIEHHATTDLRNSIQQTVNQLNNIPKTARTASRTPLKLATESVTDKITRMLNG